jgi:hypothetical protein
MTVDRPTTTPTMRRRSEIAASFAATVSLDTATTADAKPKQTPGQQFVQCVADLVKYTHDHAKRPI